MPRYVVAQVAQAPVGVSLCDLYRHPDTFSGKMVSVLGTIAGGDMWIDAPTQEPCSAWMRIIVVLPGKVRPAPDLDLVRDDTFERFDAALYGRRPVHIETTFEGRFDSAVEGEGRRVKAGEGFGKKRDSGGRIVLKGVLNLRVVPVPRR